MAKVKSLNTELTIPDNLVDEYLDMGYSLIDDKGNVVRKKKSDAEVNAELREQIKALESENATLKETIAKLTGDKDALKSSHNDSNEDSGDTPTNITTKKKTANKGV